jgi:hypothetical protein
MLNRYINFINELKEGASVTVEGLTFRNFVMPSKITIADKSYDLIAGNFPRGDSRNLRNSNNHGRQNFDRNNTPGRRTNKCQCETG